MTPPDDRKNQVRLPPGEYVKNEKEFTVFINDKEHKVKDGQNFLKAALSLGYNIPYFCWHPALRSVGACRLCAVVQFADDKDAKGRLVMSCMTPVAEGARIATDHPEAQTFRKSVLEWLMANHPHDCAVCDEGGQCHLQDMTVMAGQLYRDYRFNKRTHRNQDLGPFVNHEMNRCIQCYRCVRYYKDYAGGRDLDVFGAHDQVYFGRHEDGTLENEFSGNLVEVCPTGVFTDKTSKEHYARKWDLANAPSVCAHCSVGCNTIPGERNGKLVTVQNRYNAKVNGYFLCDRGRFGYEFVNAEQRVRGARLRAAGQAEAARADKDGVLQHLAVAVAGSKPLGIGSPRASLEANFALRALVGPENFYAGVSSRDFGLVNAALDILRKGPARSASLHDVGQSDAVLVLGEDVTNFAPMLALAARQTVRRQPMEQISRKLGIPDWHDAAVREAVQDAKGPFFIATPSATPLDDIAAEKYRAAPDDIARLGFAVANALNPAAPAPKDLSAEVKALAARIAAALKAAKRPLVISGTGSGSLAVLQASANVAWSLATETQFAEICLLVPEANSLGLAMMGGKGLQDAFEAVKSKKAETVIVLENDLYRRADAAAVDAFLGAAKHLVVIDHTLTPTAAKAEVILPASTFADGDGTFVNNEGRAQRYFQVFAPKDDIQEAWRWVRDVMAKAGQFKAEPWNNLDDILKDLAAAFPALRAVLDVAPRADFRVAGLKVNRQAARATGRTAITANVNVSEPKPPEDVDAPMNFSMEGYSGPRLPGSMVNRFWAPGWNSVQSLTKFQAEVNGPLTGGDSGLRLLEPDDAAAPALFAEIPAAFQARPGEWQFVPLYHIFGSEELSARAPAVAKRVPQAYVALSEADAAKLGVKQGAELAVTVGGATLRLPALLSPGLPAGVAGLPAGFPAAPHANLPAFGKVAKA